MSQKKNFTVWIFHFLPSFHFLNLDIFLSIFHRESLIDHIINFSRSNKKKSSWIKKWLSALTHQIINFDRYLLYFWKNFFFQKYIYLCAHKEKKLCMFVQCCSSSASNYSRYPYIFFSSRRNRATFFISFCKQVTSDPLARLMH